MTRNSAIRPSVVLALLGLGVACTDGSQLLPPAEYDAGRVSEAPDGGFAVDAGPTEVVRYLEELTRCAGGGLTFERDYAYFRSGRPDVAYVVTEGPYLDVEFHDDSGRLLTAPGLSNAHLASHAPT